MELTEAIKKIDASLAEREARQGELLTKTRETIRSCAKAIKAIHIGEEPDLPGLEAQLSEVRSMGKGFDKLTYIVYQEYAEIKCYLALSKREPLPDYEELKIPEMAWVTGLCDCIGELRRAMQIALIKGNREAAEYYFEKMEWIYDEVMTLKYSGSIAHGLKVKQDVARKQVEQARSELLK